VENVAALVESRCGWSKGAGARGIGGEDGVMRLIALTTALLAATAAEAQRTDDNATTQSDDAFGKSVGDERIGIYDPYNVRGFSAVEAGNTRIEGLYFFQQANPTDRLVDGSTMRVGIAAQGYPFPASAGSGPMTPRLGSSTCSCRSTGVGSASRRRSAISTSRSISAARRNICRWR
jgi:hypothetical protein